MRKFIENVFLVIFRVLEFQVASFWGVYHRALGRFKFRSIGRNVVFRGNVRVQRPFGDIVIGDGSRLGVGCYMLANGGAIRIGKNVGINDHCYITAVANVSIGDNCRIAEFVSLRDFDHEFGDASRPICDQGLKSAAIEIGEDVWIGRGVMVTKGVTIGSHSIIGANSVVTRNIPPYTVAAGAPCRVLRQRIPE